MKFARQTASLVLLLTVGGVIVSVALNVLVLGESLGLVRSTSFGTAGTICAAVVTTAFGVAAVRLLVALIARSLGTRAHSPKVQRWIRDPDFQFPSATQVSMEGRNLLQLNNLETIWERTLVEPTTARLKDFCQTLRVSKFQFFQNDRQEPGRYDGTADFICALIRTLLEGVSGSTAEPERLEVIEGVKRHLVDLEGRLGTPIAERDRLDHQRHQDHGGEFVDVDPVLWQSVGVSGPAINDPDLSPAIA